MFEQSCHFEGFLVALAAALVMLSCFTLQDGVCGWVRRFSAISLRGRADFDFMMVVLKV